MGEGRRGEQGVSQQKEELAERGGGERLSAGVTDGRREGERAKDETNLGKLLLRGVNALQSSEGPCRRTGGGGGGGARRAHGLVVRRHSAAMSVT